MKKAAFQLMLWINCALFALSPSFADELKILTNVIGGKTVEEHKLFIQEIEKHLGVKVSMRKPASGYDQVLLTTLASGEKYDLVYFSGRELPLLVKQRALMDLTGLIQNSEILSDPNVISSKEWDLIKLDDKFYAVHAKLEGGTMPTLRQDWLDDLNMDVPDSLDAWYDFFVKVKEKYNAYGLSIKGTELYDIQGFMSANGIKAGYVIDKNGKRTIPYASEGAIEIYDWFAKLYKERLLDPNFISNTTGDMRKLFLTDQVAAVTYWDMWVGLFNNIRQKQDPNTRFKAAGVPGIPDKNGNIILRRGAASLWGIPSNAARPDLAIKFLEFWNSEAGYMLGTVGIEGYDYIMQDGQVVLTQIGIEHGMDHGSPRVQSLTWKHPIGMLPGVEEAQAIILKFATPENHPSDWIRAEKIIERHALQAMSGKISGKTAVERMQKQLKSSKLID